MKPGLKPRPPAWKKKKKKKKNLPRTAVMDVKSSCGDQNCPLNQTVNVFISAADLDILTWGSVENHSLLEPVVIRNYNSFY